MAGKKQHIHDFYNCPRCSAPRKEYKIEPGSTRLVMTYDCGTYCQAKKEGLKFSNVEWHFCQRDYSKKVGPNG